MADEQVIVTRFTADLTGFDAGVKEYEKSLNDATASVQTLDKAEAGLVKTNNNLNGSVGSLTEKWVMAAEESARAAAAAEEVGKATQKSGSLIQRAGQFIKEFAIGARDGFKTAIAEVGGFRGILSQTADNFKRFALGASSDVKLTGKSIDELKSRLSLLQQKKGSLVNKSDIAQTNKDISSVEKQIGKLSSATSSRFGAAFASVKQGIGGVVGQIPLIGGLATALGPVGIAAAAVAGGLFKVITNTDAGATALQGLGKTGGVVFDRVTGAVTSFFDTLTSGTGIIGGTFDVLSGAVDFFINKLTPIGAIFEAISETSLFKGLKEDFEFGQQIANQLDELDDKQRGVNLTVAENEIGIRKNLSALRDTTKSAEERLKIADDITRVENENLAAKKDLLKTELGILQLEAARQASADKGKGEVDDSLKQQITDLNIALANAEADSVSLTERVASRRAGIVEQENQRKAAAQAKYLEARKKAEAEAEKLSAQRVQAETAINEQLSALALEQADRVLTAEQLEVEAVKRKYADIEKATLEGIAKLREASPANAQSTITAKEAEAIIAIEQAKNAELAALEASRAEEQGKTREEALETLRKQLLSSTELEREAVLERLDEQRALAEQNISDLEERAKVIEDLTAQAEAQLTTIVTDEQQKRIDAAKASAEEQARIAQESGALLAGFAEQSLALIVQSAASGQQVSEEASKQLLVLLFDTLEKIILMNAINAQTGAIAFGTSTGNPIAGILLGVALSALIKGLFGAAKGAILGNFDGDPFVGGDGSRPTWSGRDGYLRRLDKGERVVRGKTNRKYFDEMQAMEDGGWDAYVEQNYVLPALAAMQYNDDAKAVKFVQGDMGQRMAASITLPRMFDKGIVEGIGKTGKEQRRTNDLLEAMLRSQQRAKRNPRYN